MVGRELGDILRDGDPVRALTIYDHALGRVAETKNNTKARRNEVWLLTGSSYALRSLRRPSEAKKRIDAGLANLRNLNAYPTAKVELGEEVDVALRALADHYAAIGQTAAAIGTYEGLHAKVQAANPQPRSDLRHANGLSRIYRDLGNLHFQANHLAEAEAVSRRRLDLWRYWNYKLPNNPFVRGQLVAAQTNLPKLRQFNR